MSWLMTVALGGAAGVMNAALTGDLRLLPRVIRTTLDRIEAVQVGLIGNVVIGGLASIACVVAIAGAACLTSPAGGLAQLETAGAAVFIGFAAARLCTSQSDTRLLRRAVCKASEAPAAHPDVVTALETARPLAIYRTANELMPRTRFR